MSTAQQLGLIGNSIKVQSLPTASAETFGAGNRFYTLIGQQEGYITGHTYHTVVANNVYSWEDIAQAGPQGEDGLPALVYNDTWGYINVGLFNAAIETFNRTPIVGEKVVIFSTENQYTLATIESVSETTVGVRFSGPIIYTKGATGQQGPAGTTVYNNLSDIPVINQDLTASGFTPVANTYYRHTGATTAAFTQGVIYCYDGTEYKALDGSGGGISDVKMGGTSVVTDGVANIPPASETDGGIVTTWPQTFSGAKKIKASPSGSVQLELEPDVPATGRAYSKMRFNCITSSGTKYPFNVGMSQINRLSFVQMTSYTSTDFSFSNHADQSFLINVNTGGYSGGQVNCGAPRYQLYLNSSGYYNAVPMSNGTLMSTPSTWSSGTSGSVTLSGSGLYEIKASVGSGVFSTILNWDGSSICYSSSLGIQDTDAQALSLWHYEVGSTGILSLYKVDSTGSSTIDTTANISYRKIGIA